MDKLFSIAGKTAVITGGSGVLGSNIAKGFLSAGAKVFIVGAHQEKVDAVLQRLQPYGDIGGKACNVLRMEDLRMLKDELVNRWQHVDILVNAAGGNIPGGTLAPEQTIFDMKTENLNKVVDLNLYGSIYPCLVFGEVMSKQGQGSIVNVSSMSAISALTRVPGYSVAKSGIDIFTKWLATEMAMKFSEKIRVNAIAPGFFIGEQNRAMLLNPDGSPTERSRKILGKTPMNRFGNIDELNGAVQFLCSDAASFVTGIVMPIDGGFSAFSGV